MKDHQHAIAYVNLQGIRTPPHLSIGAFMFGHVSMLEISLRKLIDPGPIGSPSVGSISDYSLGSVAEKPGSCILLIIQLYIYIYN